MDQAESLLDGADGANEVKLLLLSEPLCSELVGPEGCGEKPGVIGDSACLPQ